MGRKFASWLCVLTLTAAGIVFSGCRSTAAEAGQNKVAHIANRTRTASVTATVTNRDFPKNFFVVADPAVAEDPLAAEVIAYTVNGLKSLRMTQAKNAASAEMIVTVNFYKTAARRMSVYFTMTAKAGDQECWQVKSWCSSRPEDIRPFLPGLVAATLPYVGIDQGRAIINLAKHSNYVQAVYGNF